MFLVVTARADDEAFDRLEGAIDEEMLGVVERAGEALAREARASHAFRNRSGDLEASIRGVEPGGSFLADTLAGGTVAAEPYGSFVEARMPFLAPAWQVIAPYMDQDADYALARAARAAGWV